MAKAKQKRFKLNWPIISYRGKNGKRIPNKIVTGMKYFTDSKGFDDEHRRDISNLKKGEILYTDGGIGSFNVKRIR